MKRKTCCICAATLNRWKDADDVPEDISHIAFKSEDNDYGTLRPVERDYVWGYDPAPYPKMVKDNKYRCCEWCYTNIVIILQNRIVAVTDAYEVAEKMMP